MHPRIAVLGCGYWGKNLVRNFHEVGALGMVCDPAEAGRAAASQFAPGVRVGEDFEDALAAEDITAVAIAAPAAMHYSLAKAAEKPDGPAPGTDSPKEADGNDRSGSQKPVSNWAELQCLVLSKCQK